MLKWLKDGRHGLKLHGFLQGMLRLTSDGDIQGGEAGQSSVPMKGMPQDLISVP